MISPSLDPASVVQEIGCFCQPFARARHVCLFQWSLRSGQGFFAFFLLGQGALAVSRRQQLSLR